MIETTRCYEGMNKLQVMTLDMGDMHQLKEYYKNDKEILAAVLTLQILLSEGITKELKLQKEHGELVYGLNLQERTEADKQEDSTGYFSYKISAIKMYRDRTGKSLVESKRAVENYYEKTGRTVQGNKY